MTRLAMTLLEMIIAVAIFVTAMAIAFEGLISMRSYVGSANDRMDLAAEAQKVINDITLTFSNSAWYIAPRDNTGSATDLADLATEIDYDREKAVYYPYIFEQTNTSLVTGTPYADGYKRWNDPDLLVSGTTYPAKLWNLLPADHKLPSRDVVLLRVRAGAATTKPKDQSQVGWINFSEAPATMADYNNTSVLPVVDSLGLRGSGAVVRDMPIDWESYPGADPWSTYPDEGADPSLLREFCFRVVPDPDSGKARLERCYRDGWSGTATLDKVLSYNVDRMVVDTYRTSKDLDLNQVRITLYMSKYDTDSNTLSRYNTTMTFALRSTVDPDYALNLATWLGEAGAF